MSPQLTARASTWRSARVASKRCPDAIVMRHADDPWSAPVNLGSNVNTELGESRPSLSWDAQQLLFGRAPGVEGSPPIPSDIYVSTRNKRNGSPG